MSSTPSRARRARTRHGAGSLPAKASASGGRRLPEDRRARGHARPAVLQEGPSARWAPGRPGDGVARGGPAQAEGADSGGPAGVPAGARGGPGQSRPPRRQRQAPSPRPPRPWPMPPPWPASSQARPAPPPASRRRGACARLVPALPYPPGGAVASRQPAAVRRLGGAPPPGARTRGRRARAAPAGGLVPRRMLTGGRPPPGHRPAGDTDARCRGTRMTDKVWRPVVGFEGWYEVSSRGRVQRSGAAAPARDELVGLPVRRPRPPGRGRLAQRARAGGRRLPGPEAAGDRRRVPQRGPRRPPGGEPAVHHAVRGDAQAVPAGPEAGRALPPAGAARTRRRCGPSTSSGGRSRGRRLAARFGMLPDAGEFGSRRGGPGPRAPPAGNCEAPRGRGRRPRVSGSRSPRTGGNRFVTGVEQPAQPLLCCARTTNGV